MDLKNPVLQDIATLIQELAKQLGVAVDTVYPILRRQAMIDGIYALVMLLIGIAAMVAGAKMIKHYSAKMSEFEVEKYNYESYYIGKSRFKHFSDEDESDGFLPVFMVFLIIGLITGGITMFFCNISKVITALGNPDWYVLNDLLKDFIK